MIQRIITVQVPESRQAVAEPRSTAGPAQPEVRVVGENDNTVEIPPPEIDVAGPPRYFDERANKAGRPFWRCPRVRSVE